MQNVLEKIKTAAVPERFTQDFLATKLGMKGGTPRTCIPFLKKMGFVASDGTPTDLYKQFRNPQKSKAVIGAAFKKLYARLYEMNEYFHDLPEKDLVGLIVQCTGDQKDSYGTKSTVWTINALKKIADFDTNTNYEEDMKEANTAPIQNTVATLPLPHNQDASAKGINLS